jgi:acetyltransferase-like isoleucine patch superfamily enzyme
MTEPNKLADDWFPSPLPAGVEIGEGSWLYSSFAFRHCHSTRPVPVRLGASSGIYVGTHFELGWSGEVEIGNFCTIVGAIIRTDARVVIEDYAFIAHEVVLADRIACVPPDPSADEPTARNADPPPLSIAVRRNAWIGTRAILLRGADIGEGAIVGAAAVVNSSVPPYAIVAGNPAAVVGWARSQG